MTKRDRIDPDVLHRGAQVSVLSGLAGGDDVDDLMAALAPNHVPGRFSPDVAVLELAVRHLQRAAAERLGVPLQEIARRIADRHHLDLASDGGPR